MEYISVNGSKSLYGSIQIPAAKNSVLPILAASLMLTQEAVISNIPKLSDVAVSLEILTSLGAKTNMQNNNVSVIAKNIKSHTIPANLSTAMRSSIFYLAPLLLLNGKVKITQPGGCKLGERPIDIHLDGLTKMGAIYEETQHGNYLKAENGLHGADYTLRLPSVGATETLLMAAALAKGETILRGAAKEPEIQDLAAFLCLAGAKIEGAGSNIIKISGVPELGGATYTPFGDRITAATALCACAVCGGEISIKNAMPQHMAATLAICAKMGCGVRSSYNEVSLTSTGRIFSPGVLHTDVFPHFCTDAAPLVAAALLKAEGESSITDTIFENRFACVKGFIALGANATVNARTILIKSSKELRGNAVQASDLRGGAALVIAALAAQGESIITGIGHIKRGYEDIAAMFAALGADIKLHNNTQMLN